MSLDLYLSIFDALYHIHASQSAYLSTCTILGLATILSTFALDANDIAISYVLTSTLMRFTIMLHDGWFDGDRSSYSTS